MTRQSAQRMLKVFMRVHPLWFDITYGNDQLSAAPYDQDRT